MTRATQAGVRNLVEPFGLDFVRNGQHAIWEFALWVQNSSRGLFSARYGISAKKLTEYTREQWVERACDFLAAVALHARRELLAGRHACTVCQGPSREFDQDYVVAQMLWRVPNSNPERFNIGYAESCGGHTLASLIGSMAVADDERREREREGT